MKLTAFIASIAPALLASAAFAQSKPPVQVPEINAVAGVAAIAVVGAALALIRERNKR